MADHPDLGIPGLANAGLANAGLANAGLVNAGHCRPIRTSSRCTAAAPRPAEGGLAKWWAGRSTTAVRDPTITAVRDSGADTGEVDTAFTRTRDARFGPAGQTCTNWRLAPDMVGPGPRWLIRGARMVAPPRSC